MITIRRDNKSYEDQASILIQNLDKQKKRNARIVKLGELWRGYSGSCRCPIGEYQPPFDRVPPTKEAIQKLHKIFKDSNEDTQIAIVGALDCPDPFISEAMEVLLEASKSHSVKVRINAARSIKSLGEHAKSYLNEIIALSNDPIRAVQNEINSLLNTSNEVDQCTD